VKPQFGKYYTLLIPSQVLHIIRQVLHIIPSQVRLWHFRLNRDIKDISILEKEQAEFNRDFYSWTKLLNKIRKEMTNYGDWAVYKPDIYELKGNLDTAVARTTSYNEREILLGLTTSDYYELDGERGINMK
jgi:hypothetical protein